MTAPDLSPDWHARWSDAIAGVERGGAPHYAPLFRAVRDGVVGLLRLARGVEVEAATIAAALRAPRPVIAVIPDDDHASTGPAGFPAARRLWRHANGVIIHAAAGLPEHYAAAVGVAVVERFIVLVETSSRFAPDWHEAVIRGARPRRPPILHIVPSEGAHPAAPKVH